MSNDAGVEELLGQLERCLAKLDLAPDAERRDWSEVRAELAELEQLLSQSLLPRLVPGDPEIFDASVRAAGLLAGSAALLYAAGRKPLASQVLRRARDLAADDGDRKLLGEGADHPEAFALLMLAVWYVERGELEQARRCGRQLAEHRLHAPTIASKGEGYASLPDPLVAAPALFTFNGIGTMLYGNRDHHDDGSYVATRFFTAVFIPIWPIDAYRVQSEADGWRFFYKVPLSAFTKWWQRLLPALVVAGVLGSMGVSYWQSPERQLARELEQAAALEQRALSDAALRPQAMQRYEGLLDSYGARVASSELQPAALGVAHLVSVEVPEPLAPGQIEKALSAIERFTAIPAEFRGGEASHWMLSRVDHWASAIGDKSEAELVRRSQLYEAALGVAEGAQESEVRAKLTATKLALAKRLVSAWPLLALRIYASIPESPTRLADTGAAVAALGDSDSLWQEAAPWVESWASEASAGGGQTAAAESAKARLASAKQHLEDPERTKALEAGEEQAIAALFEKNAGDQDALVALVQISRGKGDAKHALELLGPAESRGKLTTRALAALADTLSDLDRWGEAEGLLERLVLLRTPAYAAARRAFSSAAGEFEKKKVSDAKTGQLPSDITAELNAAPDDKAAQRLFSEWLSDQMSQDPQLTRLREAASRESDLVPLALKLGMIQLTHASSASGDERTRLLNRAEHNFLMIRSDAAGVPSFHLGLGQVYHRLGKVKEGEQEFAELLERDDADLSLEVARAYRELGLTARASQVAKAVYENKPSPAKEQAATLMSLLAVDLDERETWLNRADPADPFVKTTLIEVQAQRHVDAGEYDEADKKYAEAVRWYEKTANVSSASANNAALAEGGRYRCTGDAAHLARAGELMEQAIKLSPDNALVLGNSAPYLEHRGELRVLSQWLDVKKLRLTHSQAATAISAMLDGDHGAELRQKLAHDPQVMKAREHQRRAELLAPNNPEAYSSQFHWLALVRDQPGIESLKARLKRAPKFDFADEVRMREEYLVGKHDARNKLILGSQLKQLERTLGELDQSDGPSRSIVQLLMSDVHDDLSRYDDPLSHAEQALKLLEQAHEAWPASGAQAQQAWALLRLSLHRARKSSPALEQLLNKDLRRHGAALTIHRMLLAGAAEPLAAIRKQPELKQAAELRLKTLGDDPSPFDWPFATLADHPGLAAAAKRAFSDPRLRLEFEVGLLMSEHDERQPSEELWKRGAKPYP